MLKLNTIRFKNLLSVGNHFAEIQIDKCSNTLIIGKNGFGKSLMLDAICFGLYGKPFRNIPKPLLISNTNKKNLVVEIEFETQNNKYLIRRGLKPTIFDIFCNDVLVPQLPSVIEMQEYLEKYILKCNFKAFTQVVILGSAAYQPFMQLTPQIRREIVEDILDIEVFSVMFSILKTRLSTAKDDLVTAHNQHAVVASQHDLAARYNAEWLKEEESRKDQIKLEIEQLQKDLEILSNNISSIDLELPKYSHVEAHISTTQTKIDKLANTAYKLGLEKTRLLDTKNFFRDKSECPTCLQDINTATKEKHITELAEKVTKIDSELIAIDLDVNMNKQLLATIKKSHKVFVDIQYDKKVFVIQQQSANNQITKLTAKLNSKATTTQSIELDDIVASQKVVDNCITKKNILDQGYVLLKDNGIKTRIINQYIPVINKTINKYLTALDFPIQFVLDEEFKEIIKSRGRDVFTYESFSQGEKLRIDLAIILSWRDIAKLKNSVSCNLLIFDEILDSSLDTDGMEAFMIALKKLNKETNVFVISHRSENLSDKFDRTLQAVKKKGFSTIEVV